MTALTRTFALVAALVPVLQVSSLSVVQPSGRRAPERAFGAAASQQEAVWNELRLRAVPVQMRAPERFWENTLVVRPAEIVLRAQSGDQLELATSMVSALGYQRQPFRESKIEGGTGIIPLVIPGRGAFGESGAHMIALEFTDRVNVRQGVLLEAKKGDYEKILLALVRVTGLKVAMRGEDRERFPADFPAVVVAEPPSGVLPGVPTLPVRSLGAEKEVTAFAFSADGAMVATGDDEAIRFWRTASGQIARPPLVANHVAPHHLVITPDGTTLIAAHFRAPGLVVWNLATARQTTEVAIDLPRPWSFAISPDGRRAAVIGHRDRRPTLMLVDLQAGRVFPQPLATWATMAAPRVTLSADSERLLAWNGAQIRMWRSDSGEPVAELLAPDGILTASLSQDKRALLVVGPNQLARLNAVTGQVLATVETERVLEARVSPDHRFAVTVDWRRGARVWDATTLTALGEPLVGHRGDAVHDVAFEPGGTRIATVTAGHATIWDVLTQRPLGQCVTGPPSAFAGWNGPDRSQVWFAPDGRSIGTIRERGTNAAVCDVGAIGDDTQR